MNGKSMFEVEIQRLYEKMEEIDKDAANKKAPLLQRVQELRALDFEQNVDPKYGLRMGQLRLASDEMVVTLYEDGMAKNRIAHWKTFTVDGLSNDKMVICRGIEDKYVVHLPPELVAGCKVVSEE